MKAKRLTLLAVLSIATICCSSCGTPEGELTKLEVTKKPSKLVYTVGETFSTRGMVVTGTYYDATKDIETTAEYKNYYYWVGDSNGKLRLSDKTVKITDVNDYNSKIYTTVSITVKEKADPTPDPTPSPDVGEYYDSIDDSLTGTSLLSALQSLNSKMRKRTLGYAGLKTFLPKCDVNPDNPQRMVGFYNNKDLPNKWDNQATWNREHVWPKSRGGDSVEGDAFMPRPCDVDINGGRGNDPYAASGGYDPAEEGIANYRGICARIIFYCVVASPNLVIKDSTEDGGNVMGKLSDLLKWNLQYAPSTSDTAALELRVEQNRNNVIQKDSAGQGNRNPFVDHPEYACKIWGTTNSATKQICGLN